MTPPAQPPLVLHVIHHLVIGGMENGLVNLINHMPASSYRHAIACVEDYSEFRQRLTRADVDVYALRRSRIGVWGLRRELYRLCRRLRPAIVHTRNQSGLDALLPARLAGVPHRVHGEHGWDVGDLAGQRRKPALLRRLHSPLVSRYVTVSQDLKRYLVGRIGIDEARITQIYNGVDTERFAPLGGRLRDAFPPGFSDAASIVVGTVGRLQPVKDQATLMRAFAAVRRRAGPDAPRLRLAIVGDGPMAGDLRALAGELGIAEVTWFAGAIDNVPEVLRSFDVFVLPSLNEGISNTILEAMACGLPILATDVGGNPELVRDGVCGRLFRPADQDALAAHLAEYGRSDALRRSHGSAARTIAEQDFGLTAMLRRYRELYDGLTAPLKP